MKIIQTAERNSGTEESDNVIHHRHIIAYEEAAKLISGKVLEIGSGEGYGIQILAPESLTYVAIDKHPTPVSTKAENVSFVQCHVPPFAGIDDNTFDFVVTFQVVEHIKNDKFFLQEIYRVLKPEGKLILTTPNVLMSLTRNPWHVREYTPDQFVAFIHSVFGNADINGVYGNEKVMKYYEENKKSVRKFIRWDFLKLQYRLPRCLLKIPYDVANRMNRRKLMNSCESVISDVKTSDYFIDVMNEKCLDFFCIARK